MRAAARTAGAAALLLAAAASWAQLAGEKMLLDKAGFEGTLGDVQAAWGTNFALVTGAVDAHGGTQYAQLRKISSLAFRSLHQRVSSSSAPGMSITFGGYFRLNPSLNPVNGQNGAYFDVLLEEETGGGGGGGGIPSASTIRITVTDKNAGTVTVQRYLNGSLVSTETGVDLSDWALVTHTHLVLNAGLNVNFDVFTAVGSSPRGYLDVDDASVEGELVTKRREIMAGMLAKASNITTGNGYAVEVAGVREGYRRHDQIVDWPEVQIVFGDEEKMHNELHRKKGVLLMHAFIWCKGSASNSAKVECDEILGALETELETQAGANFIGLSYVDDVLVAGVEPFESVDEQTLAFQMFAVDVEVTYRYDRTLP